MDLVFTVLICSLFALPVSGTGGCSTAYTIRSVLPSGSVFPPALVPWEDTEILESFRKISPNQGAVRTDSCFPAMLLEPIQGSHAFPGLPDRMSRRDFSRPMRI